MSQYKKLPPQKALQTKGSYCMQRSRTCYQINRICVKFAIRQFVEMCATYHGMLSGRTRGRKWEGVRVDWGGTSMSQ